MVVQQINWPSWGVLEKDSTEINLIVKLENKNKVFSTNYWKPHLKASKLAPKEGHHLVMLCILLLVHQLTPLEHSLELETSAVTMWMGAVFKNQHVKCKLHILKCKSQFQSAPAKEDRRRKMIVVSRTCSEWNQGQNLLYINEFLQVSAFFRVQCSSVIQTNPSPHAPRYTIRT